MSRGQSLVVADRSRPRAEAIQEQRFATLYRTFWPVVYGRCRRLLSSRQLAEDAAQDIFLKVMSRGARLPPFEETGRWIRRVTSNHCFNHLRDQKRRDNARLELELELEPQRAPLADNLAARDLVRRVIASVPGDVGLVGWLNHVDELDQRDIAEQLNISRRTVVTRLSAFNTRARRVLNGL
jgi:RNA polymerase sigma factor (sigma-70 family)